MKITKEQTIATILETFPEAVDVMLEAGLHCVGCGANTEESLEDGMRGHGYEVEDIDALVDELNTLYAELKHTGPSDEDFVPAPLPHGVRIAGITITIAARDSLEKLAHNKSGLYIRVEAGGCSGYSYEYDFADGPGPDERTYPLSDSFALYLSDFSFEKLKGSTVDFTTGLKGSGLHINNPNTKRSCGCGNSVGF